MPEITAEEQLACALIDYIEGRPDHHAGLCCHLSGRATFEGHDPLIRGNPYDMIEMVRESVLKKYGTDTYVDPEYGPTKRRLEFAADLLKLVESGRLFFSQAEGCWELAW